jgi:regulator of protease activity HflC (stomatin/prohibitin superfamily)
LTAKGPGWYWLIPFVDRVIRVDQRIITYQLETQETITRDGVAVRVHAVLWFRADSPTQVVTAVEDWRGATVQAAETALRDAIGQSDLDHVLKDRAAINGRLQQLLREVVFAESGLAGVNRHVEMRLAAWQLGAYAAIRKPKRSAKNARA